MGFSAHFEILVNSSESSDHNFISSLRITVVHNGNQGEEIDEGWQRESGLIVMERWHAEPVYRSNESCRQRNILLFRIQVRRINERHCRFQLSDGDDNGYQTTAAESVHCTQGRIQRLPFLFESEWLWN